LQYASATAREKALTGSNKKTGNEDEEHSVLRKIRESIRKTCEGRKGRISMQNWEQNEKNQEIKEKREDEEA